MMKRYLSCFSALMCALLLASCGKEDQKPTVNKKHAADETPIEKPAVKHHIFVGYVTYWDTVMPPIELVTHVNYAFGKVADTFDAVTIKTPSRLKQIVSRRNEKCPEVKVLLSVGGWGAGNFSEMAADEKKRLKFCESCLAACKQYGLDGIDIDWEYPTSNAAGISSSKDDTRNFTLLMRDLRSTLGPDMLLTMASSSSAKYVDFKSCIEYMDFVNIMTYDMGNPPQHNAGLYPSTMTRRSTDESVSFHKAAGVPHEKIVVGVPFFGRKKNNDNSPDYWEVEKEFGKYTRKWDDVAKVPYLVDNSGEMQISYDDSLSVHLKGEYVVEKNLPGVMVWSLEGDNWKSWVLTRSLNDAVHAKDEK